jgi:hypothetical protein
MRRRESNLPFRALKASQSTRFPSQNLADEATGYQEGADVEIDGAVTRQDW